jgi:hypothetical protein
MMNRWKKLGVMVVWITFCILVALFITVLAEARTKPKIFIPVGPNGYYYSIDDYGSKNDGRTEVRFHVIRDRKGDRVGIFTDRSSAIKTVYEHINLHWGEGVEVLINSDPLPPNPK